MFRQSQPPSELECDKESKAQLSNGYPTILKLFIIFKISGLLEVHTDFGHHEKYDPG
jgi:hypothetical protein